MAFSLFSKKQEKETSRRCRVSDVAIVMLMTISYFFITHRVGLAVYVALQRGHDQGGCYQDSRNLAYGAIVDKGNYGRNFHFKLFSSLEFAYFLKMLF